MWDVIGPRVGPTLLLLGISTALSTVIGIWLGIRTGWSRGTRFDRSVTATTLTLYAMPEFWLGMILLLRVRRRASCFIPAHASRSSGMSTPGVDSASPAGWLDVGLAPGAAGRPP